MATPNALKAVADMPAQTEMETLEKKLASAAKSLEHTADRLRGRVDAFTQRGEGSTVEAVDPNPDTGTLGALHYWMRQIDKQADRLSAATADVTSIL